MTTTVQLRAPLLVGAGGAAFLAALRLRDPHVEGSWGLCPFLLATGHPCPGCGGLRAVNDLTRGDVVAALSSNLLAVALVVTLGVMWVVWFARRVQGDNRASFITINTRTSWILIGVIVVFGIVRNLAFGAWLAP